MTVLQQIKEYYMNLVPAVGPSKKITERLLTAEGVKAHPTPEDYFAERTQRLDEDAPANGRLLSKQV